MFDQINIETLILKYLQGELTEGEQRELDEWLKDDRNKKLFSRLINKQRILVKMERLDEYDWEKSWNVVERKLHGRRKFFWKYWGIAASLLGIVLLGTWMFMERNEENSPMVVIRGVEPGRVFAELVLPGGKIVELSKDSNNLFLGEGGNILRNENGVLFLTQDSFENSSVREKRFSVDMPRHESFKEVLHLIEQTRSIRIEIEGNNVFVK